MSSSSFPTIHPPSAARMSQMLSRSSSAASVSSIDTVDDDANFASLSAVPYHISSIDRDDPPRRTRKRFSSTQLMILEHLYHQTSHPTREQREVLAREASMYVLRSQAELSHQYVLHCYFLGIQRITFCDCMVPKQATNGEKSRFERWCSYTDLFVTATYRRCSRTSC